MRIGAVLAGAAALALAGDYGAAGEAPVAHLVAIQAVAFEPASITVSAGERVTWVNKDPFPHTVTAAGTFDSHSIAAGGTWTYVARKAGVYAYICSLHPTMKGTLQVVNTQSSSGRADAQAIQSR
jgi:plastocyanin